MSATGTSPSEPMVLCSYCLTPTPESKLEIEHIVPRSKGGPDRADNLVPSCVGCNRSKRDKGLFEFALGTGLSRQQKAAPATSKPLHPVAQAEAVDLLRRELADVDADLAERKAQLVTLASDIGKLELRQRRMAKLIRMADGMLK